MGIWSLRRLLVEDKVKNSAFLWAQVNFDQSSKLIKEYVKLGSLSDHTLIDGGSLLLQYSTIYDQRSSFLGQ